MEWFEGFGDAAEIVSSFDSRRTFSRRRSRGANSRPLTVPYSAESQLRETGLFRGADGPG